MKVQLRTDQFYESYNLKPAPFLKKTNENLHNLFDDFHSPLDQFMQNSSPKRCFKWKQRVEHPIWRALLALLTGSEFRISDLLETRFTDAIHESLTFTKGAKEVE